MLVNPVAALVPTAGTLLRQRMTQPLCARPIVQLYKTLTSLLNPSGGKKNR